MSTAVDSLHDGLVLCPRFNITMGTKERHERERKTVRAAILEAARDLFVAEGYQNVSMRKIADRIEYSPAAIYSYFPSKDDIFFALAEEGFRLLHAHAQARGRGDTAAERLKDQLLALSDFARAHPEHYALMFLDRSVPRIRHQYQRFALVSDMKRQMANLVSEVIADGDLPADSDPHAVFHVLMAGVHGAIALSICDRLAPNEDGELLVRDVLDTMLTGMRHGVRLRFQVPDPFCLQASGDDASAAQSTSTPAPERPSPARRTAVRA